MFLIAGITGHVGGAAARQLLAEGHGVRTLLRDPGRGAEWAQQGVDVRQGDLGDAESLRRALEGVEGAFLMVPPMIAPKAGFPEAKALAASYVTALNQARPPRVVALSSVGSEKTSGLGLITATHILEEALGALSVPVAFVRAGSFVENYLYGLKTAAASGYFDTFLAPTDHAVPMIATEDIGRLVARLLIEGWTGKKVVELGSPRTPDEVAGALGEVLGRPVKARAIPREQWTAALEAQGFPAGNTWGFEEMNDSINSGWISFGVPGTEQVAGTLTPREVFERAKG